jgi:hypothetical protein
MTRNEARNKYAAEHFEGWDEQDICRLAEFLREEYGHELVQELGETRDYDYALYD